MDAMTQSPGVDAITLYEYTARIGATIHSQPTLRNVWITAELSDVAVRGGHFYADLIQKNEQGATVARMRANLWASQHVVLRNKYIRQTGEDLRNGIKVKICGAANHHNIYGLSFNITDIDPSYVDEGDIMRHRMEILNRMKQEGLFDENRQLPLPADTQRIAIISAHGAAGLGDFLNQLGHNPDGYRFTTGFFESPMQGERAPGGVMAALERISAEAERWDCVVIIRGGGATADMNCFDNEQLARNVCLFPLPVIVGIGHERDNCVLDYIAHTRCKTPTAVAEFLVNHQREAWQHSTELTNRILREATLRLDGEKRHLAQIETFVPSVATQMIEREKLKLKNFTTAIPLSTTGLTTREKTRLDGYRQQLETASATVVSRAKDRLRATWELLEVLRPDNTLKRGYSITRVDGKAVRDAAALPPGTILETQLASGSVSSTVNS